MITYKDLKSQLKINVRIPDSESKMVSGLNLNYQSSKFNYPRPNTKLKTGKYTGTNMKGTLVYQSVTATGTVVHGPGPYGFYSEHSILRCV